MCGPSRPSEGGAIAILHPTTPPPSSLSPSSFRLLFHSPAPHDDPSVHLSLHYPSTDPLAPDACWLVIHSDGDLATRHRAPLWRIPVSARDGVGALDLRVEDMKLGVGGRGVIGRRVELLHGRRIVAEGVVGWN